MNIYHIPPSPPPLPHGPLPSHSCALTFACILIHWTSFWLLNIFNSGSLSFGFPCSHYPASPTTLISTCLYPTCPWKPYRNAPPGASPPHPLLSTPSTDRPFPSFCSSHTGLLAVPVTYIISIAWAFGPWFFQNVLLRMSFLSPHGLLPHLLLHPLHLFLPTLFFHVHLYQFSFTVFLLYYLSQPTTLLQEGRSFICFVHCSMSNSS